MKRTITLSAALIALGSTPALAHTGHDAGGLISGLSHPLLGLDHILAMVAVGLFAVQSGGKSKYTLPALFVVAMLAGGALGLTALNVPFVEAGIVGSVVLLGAAIAFGRKIPTVVSATMIAVFAMFHGVAHGAEIPATASVLTFAAGMTVSTAALHVLGLGIGTVAPAVLRIAGAAIALSGLALTAM
ncbi:urease accessory protein [Sneathiella sp. P13V-1]|uniref:HupE/UreJ family protein n=1 Tax=Sneathiella sp. P13V-1 TaxID=2697366 RepID=UPI00187BC403|nr:HupE/UreJ family protein [Sneathiella sp. P13V-1]MBE7637949.1 urease accessory protein [Sneathiella sp. P13V-1]